MKDQHELEKFVTRQLDEIKPVPPRNPHMASRGRALFLGMAVSMQSLPRQKGWSSIFRKERYAMNVLLSMLVIAGLLFGGGATVSAAQDDLPNEPLYAVKTLTEDIGLQFQNNDEAKTSRLMELVQVRVQEMVQLTNNGDGIPAEVPLRLEQHIRQAIQLCANMDDAAMNQTLLQLRERLQIQAQVMEQLQLRTQDPQSVQVMLQTRTMLQQRLQLVDQGLQNGEMFREQVRNGFQFGLDEEITPPAQNGDGQQQNGKPEEPGGPNPNPGGPSAEPGGPNGDPGNPNLNPSPSPVPDPNPVPLPGGNGGNGNGSGGGKP
jgi:hypothetical protein